jgi:hypothetical protein
MKLLLAASILIVVHALLAASAPLERPTAAGFNPRFELELRCMAQAPPEEDKPVPAAEVVEPVHEPEPQYCLVSAPCVAGDGIIWEYAEDEVNEDPSDKPNNDLAEDLDAEFLPECKPHRPPSPLRSKIRDPFKLRP